MAALFEAHVTNLGKYNEGVLAGEPLSFQAS
ncbi:MAG: antirestriction protein ArdA, partial [Oscillospiraceae bacterium]|nr:antirestriction protein ArdA [Oscillospiraceae bacterium]